MALIEVAIAFSNAFTCAAIVVVIAAIKLRAP